MNRYILLLPFLFCIGCVEANSNKENKTVEDIVTNFVSDSTLFSTSIGIAVLDMESKQEIGAYRATKTMHTASLLKLITTATVLAQKPSRWHYKTSINYSGTLSKGVVDGDIVIKGSGDPTLNSKYFSSKNALRDIVKLLDIKNIHSVKGNLILDNSAFETSIAPTWLWEDISNYYGATAMPINYHDNSYTLSLQTMKVGTVAKVLDSNPRQPLHFESQVIASENSRDNAYIFGSPQSRSRIIKGTLPAFRKNFKIKGVMPNPALSFGKKLKNTLAQNKINIEGVVLVSNKRVSAKTKQLGVINSPPLEDIIKQTNKKSINLYAEALLYLVENTSDIKTRKTQIEALKRFWKKQGLNTDELHLHDGSGLSPLNAVSPRFFTRLLQFMATNNRFKESLSISGVDGTLRNFGKGTILEKRVLGKSGTMQQVCAYAGYLTTQTGKTLSFAIMLNNSTLEYAELRKKIANLLMQLSEFRDE